MKRKHHLLFISCFIAFVSFGQLKEQTAINLIFEDWNSKETPGCAVGIVKDGKLVYAKGFGMANLEYQIPNAPNSVFRIGSTSKQFTAACIVLLAQQGKLDLEEKLQDIFPDFPKYAQKITVRHLLNHTSGIRDYLQLAYLKGLKSDDYYTDEDIMRWLVDQSELNFSPGEEYLYSNSGYWLLGQIVKEKSGVNMADYAKKEIFEPLGMKHTHFHNNHNQLVKNRASGYAPSKDGGFRISMTTLDMIGDGGIFTTINDAKIWDNAFYNSKVLNSDFWKEMTTPGLLNNGKAIKYAAGLMVGEYKGLKTIRHGGAFVGFRADLLRFPEENISIAVFANRADANPSRKANQIADILLKNKLKITKKKQKLIEKPSEIYSLKQIVGNYEIQPGVTISFSENKDSLKVVQNWNRSSYFIGKKQDNTFQMKGNTSLLFSFSNLKDKFTQTLTVLQGGRETKAQRKIAYDHSKVNLNDFEGEFYSKELDMSYRIAVKSKSLQVKIKENAAWHRLTAAKEDEFVMQLGTVRFDRKNGKIIAFKLDAGRVKNVAFVKM